MAFWYSWPSWDVELSVGALGAFAALGLVRGNVEAAACLCIAGSLLYEFVFDARRKDPTHRPWTDAGQRACGSALALIVYAAGQALA